MASVEVDQFLAQPPERVWQALTDPAQLARWLMPNDCKSAIGPTFTFPTEPVPQHGFDGVVHCEVLALEPPRLMRFSWRSGILDTVVSWSLAPEGAGTGREAARRDVPGHHGVGPDHRAVADRHAGQHDHVAAQPHVVRRYPADHASRITSPFPVSLFCPTNGLSVAAGHPTQRHGVTPRPT